MENYVGKICPFCKAEINEGDAVKVCPACGIPHHEACWEENKGCTTFGCSEQHYEAQGTIPTDACLNCGTPLSDGQAFCPKCGTPKGGMKKSICEKCGTALQEGQKFCPKCGQKVGLVVDAGVIPAMNQFDVGVQKKKKKSPIIIAIAAVAVVAAVAIIIFALSGGNKFDFNEKYSDIANKTWCSIASDGTWMKLDTNPSDIDYDDFSGSYYNDTFWPCNDMIEQVNTDLGFSSALFEKMCVTTWSQGRQAESNEQFTVSWTYHPDKGLEVMYEVKDS